MWINGKSLLLTAIKMFDILESKLFVNKNWLVPTKVTHIFYRINDEKWTKKSSKINPPECTLDLAAYWKAPKIFM